MFRAAADDDREQIHRLNHRVFAEEVGQHATRVDGRLVDKFDSKNHYFVASHEGEIVGIVAVHDVPPFSIEDKLEDSRVIRGLAGRPLEVRLLAVHPDFQNALMFGGLVGTVYRYALAQGYANLLISGIRDLAPMYRRMGFRELGPAVQSGSASIIPMAMDVANPPPRMSRFIRRIVCLTMEGEGEE